MLMGVARPKSCQVISTKLLFCAYIKLEDNESTYNAV